MFWLRRSLHVWVCLVLLAELVTHLKSQQVDVLKKQRHKNPSVKGRTRLYSGSSFIVDKALLGNSNGTAKVVPYISQLKNIRMLSRKMIEKIQKQNEKHSQDLAECYQQLGRYTRLMIANNARNTAVSQSDSVKTSSTDTKRNLTKINLNNRLFIHNELSFYLLV